MQKSACFSRDHITKQSCKVNPNSEEATALLLSVPDIRALTPAEQLVALFFYCVGQYSPAEGARKTTKVPPK